MSQTETDVEPEELRVYEFAYRLTSPGLLSPRARVIASSRGKAIYRAKARCSATVHTDSFEAVGESVTALADALVSSRFTSAVDLEPEPPAVWQAVVTALRDRPSADDAESAPSEVVEELAEMLDGAVERDAEEHTPLVAKARPPVDAKIVDEADGLPVLNAGASAPPIGLQITRDGTVQSFSVEISTDGDKADPDEAVAEWVADNVDITITPVRLDDAD